jgi:hypothetical protein
VLDDEVGADEGDSLALEVDEVDREVEEKPCEEGNEEGVEECENADDEEKVERVEETEADVRDRLLDRLKLGEVAEHPPDVKAPGALDIEEVVVNVDEDAGGGKEQDLLPACERSDDCGGHTGNCNMLGQSHRVVLQSEGIIHLSVIRCKVRYVRLIFQPYPRGGTGKRCQQRITLKRAVTV